MVNASLKSYIFWQKKSQTDNSETDHLQHAVTSLSRLIEDHDALLDAVARLTRNLLLLMQEPARKLQNGESEQGDAALLYKQTLLFQRLTDMVNLHIAVNRLFWNTHQVEIILSATVKRAYLSVIEVAKQKQLSVEQSCADALPLVKADPEKLHHVLRGLMAYGIAKTTAGGSIRLDIVPSAESQEEVIFRIKYAGPFVDQNDENMLMRLEAALNQSGPVCLDLTGIRMLVDAMGSRLDVEIDPGFSTTFVLALPANYKPALSKLALRATPAFTAADNEPDAAFQPESDAIPVMKTALVNRKQADTSGKVILLVEDNADVRYYMKTCLDRHFTVAEACNGEEGMEKAVSLMPDLIITDVMMPGLDGHALCEQIKLDGRLNHIPVILSTALAEDDYRLKGFEVQADGYLVKPYDSRVLLAQVRSLFANRDRLKAYLSNTVVLAPDEPDMLSADEAFVTHVKELMEIHMGDTNFDLGVFAELMHMSPRQLQRKFKAVLDMTPMAFVRVMRLKRAAQLLEKRAGNISQIAYQVGYSHARHFTRNFTRFYGKCPRTYLADLQRL